MENSLGGHNSRFKIEEDRICEFEGRFRVVNLENREKLKKN